MQENVSVKLVSIVSTATMAVRTHYQKLAM